MKEIHKNLFKCSKNFPGGVKFQETSDYVFNQFYQFYAFDFSLNFSKCPHASPQKTALKQIVNPLCG